MWLTMRRCEPAPASPGRAVGTSSLAVLAGIVGARACHHAHRRPSAGPGCPIRGTSADLGGRDRHGRGHRRAGAAWLVCRHYVCRCTSSRTALAPGLLLAQAIGRWGDWFNQELFGEPTTLPWGLDSPSSANFPPGLPPTPCSTHVPLREPVGPAGCGAPAPHQRQIA
ncbi:prolipoprotein diacylglyceryl transferase [Kocuria rhizophila]|nr:prolipoprotein diacylglyceryl transferase [Kocuria rhizophila]